MNHLENAEIRDLTDAELDWVIGGARASAGDIVVTKPVDKSSGGLSLR